MRPRTRPPLLTYLLTCPGPSLVFWHRKWGLSFIRHLIPADLLVRCGAAFISCAAVLLRGCFGSYSVRVAVKVV